MGRGGSFDILQDSSGIVVGCVGQYRIDATTCEIRKMYLAPNVRARGLGRRLLGHAVDRATNLGYTRGTLETASVLKEAIQLYTSYGVRRYTSDHLSPRCDQAYYLDLVVGG